MATLDPKGVIVTCTSCGRANRLGFAALGKPARCGQCKSPVEPPGTPIDADSTAAFDAAVASSALPIVIDFWAAWCGPCRMVAPELERLARATAGRYLVLKVDTEHRQDVAARFRIQSIPTMAVVAGGQEIGRSSGARPAADIQAFVEQTLAAHQRRAS